MTNQVMDVVLDETCNQIFVGKNGHGLSEYGAENLVVVAPNSFSVYVESGQKTRLSSVGKIADLDCKVN